MRVFKPMKLGLLHRTTEFKYEFRLAIGVMVYFPLDNPRTLLPEVALWKMAPTVMGKDTPLDEMYPKARGEFLVYGNAYPPRQTAAKACTVRVRVGSVEKTLVVIGNRVWKDDVPTPPELFTEMPINWEHAFGGEGFAQNPVGVGATVVKSPQGNFQPMPNVEYPARLVRSPREKPTPASFAAMPITVPQRMSKAGTYDEDWLRLYFPGPAPDVDWTLYNVAPPDQWFPEYLRGDEEFLIENMHPEHSVISGKLPNAKVRMFVTQKSGDETRFLEVENHAETVMLFPNLMRGVVIYRGVLPVAEDDSADVLDMLVACEDPAEPRAVEHYAAVRTARMDPKKGALYFLKDSDLVPNWESPPLPELRDDMAAIHQEKLVQKNMRKRGLRRILAAREYVRSKGLDPDEHGPGIPPEEEQATSIEKLPEFFEAQRAKAEKYKAEQEEKQKERLARTKAMFDELGMDFGVIEKEISEPVTGPPTFYAKHQMDFLKKIAAEGRAKNVPLPDVEQLINGPDFSRMLYDAQRKMKEVYYLQGHLQAPLARKSPEQSQAIREEVLRLAGNKVDMTSADLSAVHLSGIEVPNLVLSKALLESADLSRSDLSQTRLDGAMMSRAILSGANCREANFEGANLGGATVHEAIMLGANLKSAVLYQADFTGSNLRRADLTNADVMGAQFKGVNFSSARLPKLFFHKVNFQGCSFVGAFLEHASFVECEVSGCDFSGANLTNATFVKCQLRSCTFRKASMEKVRCPLEVDMSMCNFEEAHLVSANLRGVNLEESVFTGANLNAADLSGCNLQRARLSRIDAKESRWIRADLSEADLTGADLMNALLSKAIIQGANLRDANLYGSDLSRVKSDPNTVTVGANLKRARVHPIRKQKS